MEFVFTQWKQKPHTRVAEYVSGLAKQGFIVSRSYLQRMFNNWHWSFKKPTRVQFEKFKGENIRRYVEYLVAVQDIPLERMKFMDEAAFDTKSMLFCIYMIIIFLETFIDSVLGPKSKRLYLSHSPNLDLRYTVTVLTKYNDLNRPVVMTMRSTSNSQWDFAKFVLFCLEERHLIFGDLLILDNATVHCASDSFEMIISLLKVAGVKLVFLPAYSPELNPCEFCFGFVKQQLRMHRNLSEKYWIEIVKSFGKLSSAHIHSFYKHCIKV